MVNTVNNCIILSSLLILCELSIIMKTHKIKGLNNTIETNHHLRNHYDSGPQNPTWRQESLHRS
jgi:hypothetical protein